MPASALRRFKEIDKVETRLLGDMQKLQLTEDDDKDRDRTKLHVSEIAKVSWCKRQSYYTLKGTTPDTVVEKPNFQITSIWDEGHDSHDKWQRRIDKLGRLRGLWKCLSCKHTWWATSPQACVKCGLDREALQYKEVPMYNEELDMLGHADADVDEGNDDIKDDPIVEIKTLSEGTVRFEAVALLKKHTHTWTDDDGAEHNFVDLKGVWRDIRRPFPSHLRQGALYAWILGRRTLIVLYEYKPTQAVKEFVITFNMSMVEEMIDQVLDLRYATSKNLLPGRPAWATSETCSGCKTCVYRGTCWGDSANGAQRAGSDTRTGQEGAGAGARAVPPRLVLTSTAKRRSAESSRAVNGSGRPVDDGHIRPTHSLGGLLERAARPGADRGTIRRSIRIAR